MSEPALAAYDPRSDKGTVSGGNWLAALPLSNLQSDRLSAHARSSSSAPDDTRMNVTMPEALAIRTVLVLGTNLSTAHQYQVRIYGNSTFDPDDGGDPESGANLLYDSGMVVSTSRAVFGTLPWGDPHLWSGLTPFDDPERLLDIVYILPAPVTGQFVSVEIFDEGNSAGYVELSRLFIGRTFQLPINYSYSGNGLVFEDNSQVRRTLSGGEIRRRRVNPRVFQMAFDYVDETVAYADAYDFMRYCGFDREVYIIPDPAATGLTLQRRSFLGTITQMSPLSQVAFNLVGTGYTIKERLV